MIYTQQYKFNWCDDYQITTGHNQTGHKDSGARITADKDGLAVVAWWDTQPDGIWLIYSRRQILE